MIVRDQSAVDVRLSKRAAVGESHSVQSESAVGYCRCDRVNKLRRSIVHVGREQHRNRDHNAGGILGHSHAGVRGNELLVIGCQNRDRRAARRRQCAAGSLSSGIAIVERPVDLHAGRRRGGPVPVNDVPQKRVDSSLRRVGVKCYIQLATSEDIRTNRGATDNDIRAGSRHVCTIEGQSIIAASAAVANQPQCGSVVMTECIQLRIADRHIHIQHNRGAAFGVCGCSIQIHERGRIVGCRHVDQNRRRVFFRTAVTGQSRICARISLVIHR